MLDSLDAKFAREDAIAIAADRIGHVSGDMKSRALEWIGVALEKWKREQAGDDGTIEVQWFPGLLGFGPREGRSGATLAEIGAIGSRKRVPVSSVEPHQCAGPSVKCPADLLHWLWLENYPPAEQISVKLGLDAALALLVERDGRNMAVDSLLRSIRVLWNFQRVLVDVYQAEATKTHKQKVDIAANARAAKAERRTGTFARAEWKRIAAEIWRRDIEKSRHTVACEVRAELVRRQETAPTSVGTRRRRIPAVRTIGDAIKGVHGAVIADQSRMANRAAKR